MKKLISASALFATLLSILSLAAYGQSVTRDTKDNTVESIVYTENTGLPMDNMAKELPAILELGKGHELKLKYSSPASNGVVVSKYAQWYNNIPVEHGSVTVMAKNNRATYINANIFNPAQALSATPAITEARALDIALAHINAKKYAWEDGAPAKRMANNPAFKAPAGTLVWVEDFTQDALDKQLHLAYRFEIFAKEPLSNDRVYVDAQTGKILLKDPLMKHVAATGTAVYSGNVAFETNLLSPGSYSLEDVSRDVYTYDLQGGTSFGSAVDFTNSSTTWGKDYSIDVHWGTSRVFDYWKNEHNRVSFDGMGTEIISFLNYDISYNNAFWSGYFMVYGNGTGMFNAGMDPLVALDVCGHELGHGICQYTANLVYAGESGAMNEGFSDIWGAVIENYAAPDKQMWSVGEELRVGALRSMNNPNLYDDPDCYGGANWVNTIGCTPGSGNDQCGVHTNSGVLNYWFYLLVHGDKGKNDLNNDFEVSGIGVKKAAAIVYAAELAMNSTDQYIHCRNATINAAIALYGNCSREVEAITRAWHAVGVGAAFTPCAPQIGFAIQDTAVNKVVPGIICPSSKLISIPLRVMGNAPAGGNATVTVAGTGNVNGGDYSIPGNTLTFNAGSTASQNVQVNIFDNGDVTQDKLLKLYFTIAQNGSNATVGYTYDTCYITILGSRAVPDTGSSVVTRVNDADIKSKAITPFFSRQALARTQFIIRAEELQLAGIKPNTPITALEFNVTEKNSAQPFNNFNLKIDPTQVDDLSAGNPTVSTVYHNSNYSTQLGWNRLSFSTPLVWNGTDNLAIETCFTNASAGAENDYVQGVGTGTYGTTVVYAGSGSNGCNLLFSSGFNYFSVSKPVIRLVQNAQPIEAEKIIVSSKPWEVHPGQDVYFQNDTNSKVIANIKDPGKNLGCTNVFITAQGAGLVPVQGSHYPNVKRSVKEYSVTAQNNTNGQSPEQYEITLFFDTSELSGVNLANVRVVGTDVPVDSMMHDANTEIALPVVMNGKNYISFKAQFKSSADRGINGRYFITENNFILWPSESVAGMNKNTGNISVVNNPFTNKIYVNYNLQAAAKAQVKLYDITGRVLLNNSQDLQAGSHGFEINTGNILLAPGNYILQITTGSEVLTQKMVKQ